VLVPAFTPAAACVRARGIIQWQTEERPAAAVGEKERNERARNAETTPPTTTTTTTTTTTKPHGRSPHELGDSTTRRQRGGPHARLHGVAVHASRPHDNVDAPRGVRRHDDATAPQSRDAGDAQVCRALDDEPAAQGKETNAVAVVSHSLALSLFSILRWQQAPGKKRGRRTRGQQSGAGGRPPPRDPTHPTRP
jgi:hypothetical protein